MSRRAGLALFFASAAWLGSVAAAEKEDKPPVFGTGVSIVSLPVFVVDGQGKAMGGLQAEDFELSDDGKRVPVVSFQYIDTTSPEEQEAIRQAPAARRRFLLLFDLSFTELAGLHRAREAGMDFVRRRLAESDLAAVATFDVNRGVRLVANFTEDRALLVHAVDTLGVPTLARITDPLGLAASIAPTDIQVGRSGGATSETAAQQVESVFAVIARRLRAVEEEQYRRQVLNLVGSLEELGKSLRGVEGRKQVLYFSAGFDARALLGATGSEMRRTSEDIVFGRIWEVDSMSRYGDTRLRQQLLDMTRLLARADCVVHTVDVTGLGGDSNLQQTPGTDTLRDPAGRDSLHFLASETGGRLFKDANDLSGALREVADMTSRYYILGYQPEDLEGPGRFHKLKVKVRRKQARVSHRTGYFERVPRQAQTVLQRKFEAAQLVMTGVGANDLKFSALCLPFPVPGEKQVLGLVVQVPRDQLRWKAKEPVSLEVYGYAVAQDGSVHDHLAQFAQVNPELADPKSAALGLSFYGTLQVPAGHYTLKVMIQEPETGAAGIQFLDVQVPPFDPRVGFLLPPVVMDDPALWLGLALGKKREGAAEFPFEVGGRPFLPRASFRLSSGTPEKLVLMAFDPSGPSDTAAAGLEIQSVLTDAHGVHVPTGAIRIDRVLRGDGGRRTYVLAYTPQGLAPGDYTLRVGVGEAGTRLESYALVRVAPGPAVPQ